MELHSLSKVVTSFFYVIEHLGDQKFRPRPGLDLLAAELVRTAANRIFVPYHKPLFGSPIEEVIKQYPPSLVARIEIVDRDGAIYERVSNYLRPIYEEVKDTPYILAYNNISDFLYKLTIASKLQAEADVSMLSFIGFSTNDLRKNVKDEEARFRLDQLYGVYSIYQKLDRIDVLTMLPGVSIPSIYDRINELLNEAEIIELSKDRYLLGIPSKAKIALQRIKLGISNISRNKKYKSYIGAASDLIQIAGASHGVPIPSKSVYEVLKNIQASPYNPPLIDLDYFRVRVCKLVSPGRFPNFILPDGATRGMADEYFSMKGICPP